jgi:acetyl/propionyl-CoA carboxylase alpha subunit
METSGVPVVPGEAPVDQSDTGVERALARVGFPALVKASAGGGGKGMREIREAAGGREMIQAARREAQAAFGDGTLYVERLIDRPRHVEVQIIADHAGRVAHLFERECQYSGIER